MSLFFLCSLLLNLFLLNLFFFTIVQMSSFCYSLPSLSVFWGVILKTFSVVFMIQCIPIFSRGCITTIPVASRSPQLHFVEAVDDDDEFRDIGGKSSDKDIFRTLATDFRTEAPARQHRLRNCSLPN